jgi:AcrR family transcriptional regulator
VVKRVERLPRDRPEMKTDTKGNSPRGGIRATVKRRPGRPSKIQGGRPSGKGDNAERILDVALNLFARSSFWAVTIKDIGKATGLNAAMIYYYFRDKEDLFRAAVEISVKRAFQGFESRNADADGPEAIISGWLDTHINELDLIRKLVKVSLDYANSGNRIARIDRAIEDFYDHERTILMTAMREGISSKRFRPIDVKWMSSFISTFLDGVMVRSMISPDFDPKIAINGLRKFVLSELRGRNKKDHFPVVDIP